MAQKSKKTEVRAVCKECSKTFYSLTTNKDGKIVCPTCDKSVARNQKY